MGLQGKGQPPLHRLETILNNQCCRTMIFQRTATTPLIPCLSPRVHSSSAPSPAPRRRRSQGNFAKRQALSAIVNDDVSWLVLPHPHSALSRRPVTILPRELQQAVFVTHHPVFTEHSFFLQPEHVVQLSRRGTLPT